MKNILTAVTSSVVNKSEVTVTVTDVEAAINFIHRQWVDVDFDRYPDRVTIFGSEKFPVDSPDSDLEGTFVLNLAIAPNH
jgi:hypothetical protein